MDSKCKLRALADTRLNKLPIGLLNIDGPFYLNNDYFVRDRNRTIILIDDERDDYIKRRRENCADILRQASFE